MTLLDKHSRSAFNILALLALGALAFVTFRKLIIFYKGTLGPYLPFDPVWLDLALLGIARVSASHP